MTALSQGRAAGELIVLAQAGDEIAMAALLAACQPDIRRYARVNCRLEDIDDAVQDTLWRIARSVSALRAVASFGGWVFAITKRECYRLARKVMRNWQPLETVADDLSFATRPEPELRQDIVAALQSLPAHYRSIVLRRDFEERTIDEIAELEGLSREAVKARLRRARLLIREYLT
jgi:RNA polymerase sigma factor (sigma-70 family)